MKEVDDQPNEVDKEEEEEYADWDNGIYCQECWLWTNGPTQYEEHCLGTKHRKSLRRNARARARLNLQT